MFDDAIVREFIEATVGPDAATDERFVEFMTIVLRFRSEVTAWADVQGVHEDFALRMAAQILSQSGISGESRE